MKEPIERLTDELREDTSQPRVDWDAVDEKLFARVRAEIAAERRERLGARARVTRVWLPAAAVLAAAAAIAMVVGRGRDPKPVASNAARPPVAATNAAPQTSAATPVVTVVSIAAGAEVLIDGRAAKKGASVVNGSRVETRGGRALLARDAGTAMVIDANSAARLTRDDSTLLLALERGAVEAKVDGRSSGAFAVGVGDARVTTQASHVRVATGGAGVVVDVTEGTVAIGDSAIDSPAHAELSPADVNGTLRIDHAPSAVRPAISFAIELPEEAPTAALAPPGAPPAPTTAPALATSALAARSSASSVNDSDPASAPAPAVAPSPAVPSASASPSESAIANAVRACLAARPAAAGVKLSVSTTVKLSVAANGAVTLARFDPPIAPEAQSCAAATIYKVRFASGGDRAIAVDFKHEK